ncbi:MAG: TonB family protein [Reyranella sp.]|nr:TonB family protein [Reyranella sp.]
MTLHGLAVLPLFLIAGTLGSTSQEPALIVEFAVAAPTVGPDAEPDGAVADLPSPPEPPLPTPVEMAAQPPEPQPPAETAPPETAPEPEVVTEIAVDLPPPEEPPPLNMADLKPAEPPKPKPAPKPAAPRPAAKPALAQAATAPDTGNAAATQQATAAPAETIVFEGRPRYRVPPKPAVYPARAIEFGQQGEVLIRVRLDLDGSAAEIKLWRSSGFEVLDRSALAAARGWHFHPAMRGGHPVAAWVEIPVRFHLH